MYTTTMSRPMIVLRVITATVFILLALTTRVNVWATATYVWIALLSVFGIFFEQKLSLDLRSYTPASMTVVAVVVVISVFLFAMALIV